MSTQQLTRSLRCASLPVLLLPLLKTSKILCVPLSKCFLSNPPGFTHEASSFDFWGKADRIICKPKKSVRNFENWLHKNMKPLAGKVALLAGATRGAGRGIAIELGAAGATVYCT